MDGRELDTAAREYYAERYDVVVDYEFEAKPPIRLNDRAERPSGSAGRFCGLGMPAVTFKKKGTRFRTPRLQDDPLDERV